MKKNASDDAFIARRPMGPFVRVIPIWIEVWLIVSGVICFLDVMFTMLRPYTTTGFLRQPYYGWNLYADVDKRYADEKDIVTCATGRVMLFEVFMNFLAVFLAHIRSRHAVLTAFTSTAFVLWKTVVFLTLYIRPPEGTPSYFTEGSSYLRIFLIFWIPNGIWIVIPLIVMIALWNRLALPVKVEQEYRRNRKYCDSNDSTSSDV